MLHHRHLLIVAVVALPVNCSLSHCLYCYCLYDNKTTRIMRRTEVRYRGKLLILSIIVATAGAFTMPSISVYFICFHFMNY